MIAVLGITFWLGTHDLEVQSLWPDEAYSWEIASKPLTAIGQDVLSDQIHVPGYYFLLHYWQEPAGSSPYSMRFFSVLAGVAAVAALTSLVRSIAGARAAVLAGLLAAVHPFLLYYLQETRMYSLLLAVVLIELRLLVRCIRRPASWRWFGYGGMAAASLYTHYTAVVLLPVAALTPALLKGRDWRLLRTNAGVLLTACALFVPWALFGIRQFNTFAPLTGGHVNPGRFLSDYALAANLGEVSFETRQQLAASVAPWLFVAAVTALVMLGVVRKRAGFWLVLFLVPTALVIGIAINGRDFSPRYAIASLAGYVPLVALGLLALPKLALRVVCGAVVIGGFLWCDRLYFTDPEFQRQDFRGAVAYAMDHAVPSDAIILLSDVPLRRIWHYYGPSEPEPRSVRPPTDDALRSAIGDSDRAELVLWQDFDDDPQHRVKAWLDREQHSIFGWGSGEVAVYGYFTRDPYADEPPPGLTPVGATFSNQIQLVGYREWSGVQHRGLRLQLVWRRLQPLGRDYRVFVHLVDAQGANLAIADHRPAFDTLNLSQWQGKLMVIDEYDLSGDWRPGERLEIGLYDPPSGERLSPASLPLPLDPR